MHMATQLKRWTLEEVHSLPDDGNKYELVHGELFVTPAPTTIMRPSRPTPCDPRSVRRDERARPRLPPSCCFPLRRVRRSSRISWCGEPPPGSGNSVGGAPLPILIVEVFSPTTRRRDQIQKRTSTLTRNRRVLDGRSRGSEHHDRSSRSRGQNCSRSACMESEN